MKVKLRPTSAIIAAFLLAFVVSVSAQSGTTSNGGGWGSGGKPKPSPTPPGPVIDPDGTWTSTTNGNWSDTTRWSGGIVADGGGFANFSTLNITAGVSVTIDNTSRTVGRLDIGDTNSTDSYTIKSGGGASLIFDNTANSANAQLNEVLSSNGDTISAPIVLKSSLDITNVSSPAATLTLSGGITAGTAGTKTITTSSGLVAISGIIGDGSGTVAVTQNGPGTLTLSGVNTYSGDTTINGGVLLLGNAAAIPSGAGKGNVVIGSSGTLETGDKDAFSINGLSGSGVVQKTDNNGVAGAGNNDTMTIGNNNANGSFSGVIQDGGGGHAINIVKTGAGTQIFSGANTYAGTTVVNGGTLFVNNTTGSGTGTGAVTVSNSGTVLGGTGTISGTVTLSNVASSPGAILEGGTGSTGQTLTLANSLTLGTNSIIELALGPSLTHSTLARTGSGAWSFQSAQKFTFILNPGTTTGFYNNIITGLASDPGTEGTWTVTNAGFIATFSYDGGAGPGNIDLTVTAVPEPSTYFAASLALLALAYFQRKRLTQILMRTSVAAAK